jgi:ketosteroid isomerase-like protein
MKVYLLQLLPVLLLIHLIACNNTSQKQVSSSKTLEIAADSLAIRNTLDNWYNAMYRVDSIGVLKLITSEFLLLEGSIPFSGAELVSRLKNGDKDTKWAAHFSEFKTRIQGDVAWTTVKNHETSVSKDGKKCKADFLETIVFVRKDKQWLIDRYHAAEVNQWKCEE